MKIKIVMSKDDYILANEILVRCGYELPAEQGQKGVMILESKDITPWLKKLKLGLNLLTPDVIMKYRKKVESTVLQIIKLKKLY